MLPNVPNYGMVTCAILPCKNCTCNQTLSRWIFTLLLEVGLISEKIKHSTAMWLRHEADGFDVIGSINTCLLPCQMKHMRSRFQNCSKFSWMKKIEMKTWNNSAFTSIILQGSRRRERPQKYNTQEWTGQSVSSLLRITDDRNRWANQCSRGICRSWRAPTTPGHHGSNLIYETGFRKARFPAEWK